MFSESAEALLPYRHGDKAVSRKAKQRANDKSRIRGLLRVPFIAWDGEGITREDGKHVYILLANSRGDVWRGTPDKPLTTETILYAFTSSAAKYGNAIHVIYGGSYDANMAFADCTENEVRRIYHHFQAVILRNKYNVRYRAGKSLWLKHVASGATITLYDVVSFFQCSFVKAMDSYFPDGWPNDSMIREQKANRSQFRYEDMAEIQRYCNAELDALVMLMDELRQRFHDIGLRLSRWDGPGACAAALLKREGIKHVLDRDIPADVARAGRYAYAGGRFELIRFGHKGGPVWEYDICSAYPSAMRQLPNLRQGLWVHHDDLSNLHLSHFTLCRVKWAGFFADGPTPLFRREPNGTVCYPYTGEGWYWLPEVLEARDFQRKYGGSFEVVEAWEFVEDDPKDRPFAFIGPMYTERQRLKREGNGAHTGYKLALNSLYGKTAQQTGWRPATIRHPQRIPPFHQLEYAGWITSYTRAKIFRAAMQKPHAIVAFETDALFSSEPLNLHIGTELGQWEETRFADLSYYQSGLYVGVLESGKQVVKTRGIEAESLPLDKLESAFINSETVAGITRRFIGMGVALQSRWDEWREWQVQERNLHLYPAGKRDHPGCSKCKDDRLTPGVWHDTIVPMGLMSSFSCEFPVEWLNPNPAMILQELRVEGMTQWEAEYDD